MYSLVVMEIIPVVIYVDSVELGLASKEPMRMEMKKT